MWEVDEGRVRGEGGGEGGERGITNHWLIEHHMELMCYLKPTIKNGY